MARAITVVEQDSDKPQLGPIARAILITILAVVLPGVQWSYFAWTHFLLPLLGFYLLWRHGEHAGKRLLLTAAACGMLVLIIQGQLDLAVFAITLLLSGYALYISAKRDHSPVKSGMIAVLVLGVSWILMIAFSSLATDHSPYTQFIGALEEGVDEALAYYRQNETISAETLAVVETTLLQMRHTVPLILPALIGSMLLMIVWFAMVFGNVLVSRTTPERPWPSYRLWQLPERLIWLLIGTGILALLPLGTGRLAGINLLILLCLIYGFQGLSILVFFMHKWNVPVLFRSFIYVMIVFQSLGTLILLFIGVADNWMDFRKLKGTSES